MRSSKTTKPESLVPLVSRRNALSTLAAIGLVHGPTAVQATADEADVRAFSNPDRLRIVVDQPEKPVKPLKDLGYRLYKAHTRRFNESFLKYTIQYPEHLRVRPQRVIVPLWATKAQADEFAKMDGVLSVYEVKPQLTQPKDVTKNGMVLYVDTQKVVRDVLQGELKGFATPHQMADAFRKNLKSESGVEVDVIKPPKDADSFTIVREGQLRIRCRDPRQARRVLKVIQSQPQVYHIRWESPFKVFLCPFCGIG